MSMNAQFHMIGQTRFSKYQLGGSISLRMSTHSGSDCAPISDPSFDSTCVGYLDRLRVRQEKVPMSNRTKRRRPDAYGRAHAPRHRRRLTSTWHGLKHGLCSDESASSP